MHIGPHIGPGRRIGGIFVPPAGSGFYADYTRGRYATAGVPEAFAAKHTFTRASVADWLNSSLNGLNPQVASNVPRIDGRGYLAEAAFTGGGINSQLVGAVPGLVGGAGSLPTGHSGALGSTTTTLDSIETVNGVECVRILQTGTGAGGVQALELMPTTYAATPGQVFSASVFYQLLQDSGILTDVQFGILWLDAGLGVLSQSITSIFADRATFKQHWMANAVAPASTAFARPRLRSTANSNPANDIVRYGGMSIAPGQPTSPIIAGTTALTRNIDLLTATISGIASGGDWTIAGQSVMPSTTDTSTEAVCAPLIDGSNRWVLKRDGANNLQLIAVGGGVVHPQRPTIVAPALDTVFGYALKRTGADMSLSINGSAVATATPATMPVGALNTLGISNNAIGAQALNNRAQKIVVFPAAKSDAELQALSTLGGIP